MFEVFEFSLNSPYSNLLLVECEYRLNETEFDSMSRMSKSTLVRYPLVFAVPMLTVIVPGTAVTQMCLTLEKLLLGNRRDILNEDLLSWSLQEIGHACSVSADKHGQL